MSPVIRALLTPWLTAAGIAAWRCVAPVEGLVDDATAARLYADLAVISAAPRPAGSAAHAAVRAFLVEELRAAGFQVELQEAEVRLPGVSPARSRRVINVVARHEGAAEGIAEETGGRPGGASTLLLVSHYDSVPESPGASDAGGGLVALLAAARVLGARAHRNDVIVLFTDREEEGLHGARAFAADHPAWKEVGAVLNFEARGSRGPSAMFQTGPDSGVLLEALARTPHPVASSLAATVYAVLPNDTDLTVLPDRPALNFAWFDGLSDYHQPTDDLAHLEPRSLAHHARYALDLGVALADADLTARPAPAVYFASPLGLVRYGIGVAWAILLLATAGLVAGVRASWRAHPSPSRMGLGLLAGMALLPGAAAIGAVAVAGAATAIPWISTWEARFEGLDSPNRAMYRVGLTLLGVGVTGLFTVARGRPGASALLMAWAPLPWVLLTGVSLAFVPGGSYLFGLPALALALPGLLTLSGSDAEERAAMGRLLLAPLALVAIVPTCTLLFPALPLGWAAIALMPGLLLVPALAPSLAVVGLWSPRLAGLSAAVGLALVIGRAWMAGG